MNLSELHATLKQLNIHLQLKEDKLQINAPKGSLTAELKAALNAHKAALIAELKERTGPLWLLPLLAHHAQQTPDAIALRELNGDTVTYQALAQRSNQLAHWLQQEGITQDKAVGLCTQASISRVIGFLGILKAGGIAVLWESGYLLPNRERQLFAELNGLLTEINALERLPSVFPQPFLVLDRANAKLSEHPLTPPAITIPPQHVAYHLHTSEPLRYPITQQNLATRLRWLQQVCPLTATATVLHYTIPHRDVGLWEFLWPLTVGATVVITPRFDACYLREAAISTAFLTPAQLVGLTQEVLSLPNLRTVIISGQPLLQRMAEQFLTAYPHVELHHVFTAPESESALHFHCQPQQQHEYVPLEKKAEAQVLILDRFMRPVPIGVAGEMYLPARPQDYPGAPHLSASRFVSNPLTAAGQGERLFRPFKRARWLSATALELLGGTDRQAWHQGLRLDLNTIEALLLQEPSVAECVVLERHLTPMTHVIIAYVVCNGLFSAQRLAQYIDQHAATVSQVPDAYVPVTALPLTPQGEVDTAALQHLPVARLTLTSLQQAVGGQAAVLLMPRMLEEPPLHLADLLPNSGLGYEELDTLMPAGAPLDTSVIALRPPALSEGGPLSVPAEAPLTMTAALLQTAARYPDKGIVYVDIDGREELQTYADLVAEAQQILAGLQAQGLRAGDRAILQVESLRDHFSSFWACALGGIIPVTVAIAPTYRSSNAVVNKLYNIWQLLAQPPLITSNSLVSALQGLSSLFDCPTPTTLPVEQLKQATQTAQLHSVQPDDIMFYQLSSGSTGTPKCIQERHYSLVCHVHGSQQFNQYAASNVSLNWLPRDHVVPILTFHLKDTYLGCQQIQLKTEQVLSNPLWWLTCLDRYRVTHSWSPNFGFKLVSDALKQQDTAQQWDLSCIQFLMNAGEQVTRLVMQDFLAATAPFGIRSAMIQPAFGMAEVCTCMTYQNEFDLDRGVFRMSKSTLDGDLLPTSRNDPNGIDFVHLGPPMPGVAIRIANADNQTVREGVIGRFQIRGEVVTPGYLKNPEANAEAFVGQGWFNSGDLGFILNGKLALTGRLKEMIVVRGANFYCYEIEDVVNAIAGVEPTFTGTCSVSDEVSGTEGLAIFFVPKQFTGEVTAAVAALVDTIRREVSQALGLAPAVIVPLTQAEFPKTTSGKIQRAQLKTNLSQGRYQEILRCLDLAQGNANTLPAFFYQVRWEVAQAYSSEIPHQLASTVLFLDQYGLGEQLCQELKTPCVCVTAGERFVRQDRLRYQINPANAAHYLELFQQLKAEQIPLSRVVHVWSYSNVQHDSPAALNQAQNLGLNSVRYLMQALTQLMTVKPLSKQPATLHLYLISRNSQAVLTGDPLHYGFSPLAALVRTLAQEVSWLKPRHIDLGQEAISSALNQLHTELASVHTHLEVAWRHQQRWVPRLAQVRFSKPLATGLPLNNTGFYLISGGLGGVASLVAGHLLQKVQPLYLLLVGRRRLDQLAAMEQQRYRQLQQQAEQQGSQVRYAAVDITDLAALQSVVADTSQHWALPLIGIWHLAGVYAEGLVSDSNETDWQAVLAPKVQGSWALHQLVAGQKNALFIHFSSVLSTYSGAMIGAYACANRFVEGFAEYQRQQGINSLCLSWSTWHNQGMSAGYSGKAALIARGVEDLAPEQALKALDVALIHQLSQVLIGLNGCQPYTRAQRTMRAEVLERCLIYYETETVPPLSNLALHDAFGTPLLYEFHPLPALPRTASGAVDFEQLQALAEAHEGGPQHVAPRTEVEMELVELWQNLLNVPRIGIEDNFFQLGGHSLLAMHLMAQIQTQFQVNVPLSALFEQPTIQHLANLISTESPAAHLSLFSFGEPTTAAAKMRPPLFCLPGLSGSAVYLQTLAAQCLSQYPFYSFQAPGLAGEAVPLNRVEDLAAHYLTALRAQQPNGPYYLSGHSFGSYVAFEMARQLQAAGETVSHLVVMDIQAPVTPPYRATEADDEASKLRRLIGMLAGLSQQRFELDYVQLATLSEAEQLQQVFNILQQAQILPPNVELTHLGGLLQVFRANTEAYFQYHVDTPADFPITLLRCAKPIANRDPKAPTPPPDLHWQALTRQPLTAITVPGEHFTLLTEPHVIELVQQLPI